MEGAGHTDGSLPFGTEGVVGSFQRDRLGINDAVAIVYAVTGVATGALSIGVPISAVVTHGGAHAIGIGVEPD